jgi:hypothetical protein
MASITEIANRIKEAFVNHTTLRQKYELEPGKSFDEQFSAASVEALMIETHATAAATLETMHEWHLREIAQKVEQERYGYPGWYRRMMLAFQYGDDVNQLEEQTFYDVIDPDKQIVKFAYCQENTAQSGVGVVVVIKIAKAGASGMPEILTPDEETAATAYINRVKPAGIPVLLINEQADRLLIHIRVRYNPMLLISADAVDAAVKNAINGYINGLTYNGAFVAMRMIDALQATSGIEIAQTVAIAAAHAGYPSQDITELTHYTPHSGALRLDEDEFIIEKEVGYEQV